LNPPCERRGEMGGNKSSKRVEMKPKLAEPNRVLRVQIIVSRKDEQSCPQKWGRVWPEKIEQTGEPSWQ